MQSNKLVAMEQSNIITLYELCRLCLDERGSCDIFGDESLPGHIYKCTGVKVSLNDHFPQKICGKCLEIVNKATALRIAAKKNDCHLKSVYHHNKMMQLQAYEYEEPSNDTTQPISPICDKEDSAKETNSGTEKFISVRKDLFISSVSKDSSTQNDTIQVDSSQEPISRKRQKYEDGNTLYECSICSKKFDKWKKLYLHSRLHNKNFECQMLGCEKKFSTKGDLEKHIRTHTGEKPYQCDFCDKSFSQRGSLKAHKESIHSVG